MESLISDLLMIIFDYCSLSDLVHLKQVKKRYNKLILKNYQSNIYSFKIKKSKKEYSKTRIMIYHPGSSHILIPDINDFIYGFADFRDFISNINLQSNARMDIYLYFNDLWKKDNYLEPTMFLRIKYNIFSTKCFAYLDIYRTKIKLNKNQIEVFRLFKLIYNYILENHQEDLKQAEKDGYDV